MKGTTTERTTRRFARCAAAALAALAVLSCAAPRHDASGEAAFEIDKNYTRGPLSLDLKVSRKEITIADQITLAIEATAEEDYHVELPKFGEKLEQFGIVDYRNPPPRLLEGGRVLTCRSYVLEPFLSGEYKIPPMTVRFWSKAQAEPEKHELKTEELVVKVKSILPETHSELKIEEIAGPVELPRPGRAWLLAILAAAAACAAGVGLALWRHSRRAGQPQAARLPAHELAYRELERLLADQLIEDGKVKLFYQRISSILRHYIENRLGLRAPEQTTEEFLAAMSSSEVLAAEHKTLLREFLGHCDLVKFAELQPTSAQIQKSFDACKDFIEATKADERRAAASAA